MTEPNATFHCFKPHGKWYATARGVLTPEVFKLFDRNARREQILKDNGGKYPGLSGAGMDLIFVVFGDEDIDHGYPLMLYPKETGIMFPDPS